MIHGYRRGWRDGSIYDAPVPGAVEGLRELTRWFEVVVLTARPSSQMREVERWVEEHTGVRVRATAVKPPAVVYLDDRALRFVSWPRALAQIGELAALGAFGTRPQRVMAWRRLVDEADGLAGFPAWEPGL